MECFENANPRVLSLLQILPRPRALPIPPLHLVTPACPGTTSAAAGCALGPWKSTEDLEITAGLTSTPTFQPATATSTPTRWDRPLTGGGSQPAMISSPVSAIKLVGIRRSRWISPLMTERFNVKTLATIQKDPSTTLIDGSKDPRLQVIWQFFRKTLYMMTILSVLVSILRQLPSLGRMTLFQSHAAIIRHPITVVFLRWIATGSK